MGALPPLYGLRRRLPQMIFETTHRPARHARSGVEASPTPTHALRDDHMTFSPPSALWPLTLALATLTTACTVYQAPPPVRRVYVQPPVNVYVEPIVQPVISVYVEPPISQPAPILIGWAPPPMLVEIPVPVPYASAVWVGGYWVWEGNWIWAAGHWMAPPEPNYAWVHPYYEHRDGGVVFITGHWSPPGVVFVAPALTLHLTLVSAAPGVVPGPAPIGPLGVFVPPPPGSRMGLIVPAPIGTPPAVVTSAAPVVNVGMRIQSNTTTVNNSTVNNTNVTNVTNITNVTIVAPASATASGKAFETSVPAQAHLAAALQPAIRIAAPVPVSAKAIPAFVPGRSPVSLPPPQMVRSSATPAIAAAPVRPSPPPSAGPTSKSVAIPPPPQAAQAQSATPAERQVAATAAQRPATAPPIAEPLSVSGRPAAAAAKPPAVPHENARAAGHPSPAAHERKKKEDEVAERVEKAEKGEKRAQ